MKAVTVASADIAAEPGQPMDPRYWTSRRSGETYEGWRLRTELERQVAHVRRQLEKLKRLYPGAWAVVEQEEKEAGT